MLCSKKTDLDNTLRAWRDGGCSQRPAGLFAFMVKYDAHFSKEGVAPSSSEGKW